MKLPLETLEWLFLTSIVYLTVGTFILAYGIASIQLVQITWIWITAAPLFIPMRNIVKINTIWSK